MATLFERLDEEEAVVRGELDALREKMAAAEERLARLTITRETARSLLTDVSADDETPPLPRQSASWQPPTAGPAPAQPRPPRAARVPSVGVGLDEAIEKILVLLTSAGREMKVRDIAVAIGEKASDRRIETTRSRLKSLAKQGLVTEGHPGWFRIAPTVGTTGHVNGEAAGMR
ncbi:hypothetical protein KCMC57_up27640 [Kitasatospora sp. CMC57]|uniref:Uncharacterized protein n=1 Tax=Kitasatospora sp. CMC57 TaxID=3231513 RepID=A0AB33JYN0_9ACTN